jgi:hypothetical protein
LPTTITRDGFVKALVLAFSALDVTIIQFVGVLILERDCDVAAVRVDNLGHDRADDCDKKKYSYFFKI